MYWNTLKYLNLSHFPLDSFLLTFFHVQVLHMTMLEQRTHPILHASSSNSSLAILNTSFQGNTETATLQCDDSNWVTGRLSNTNFFFWKLEMLIFFCQWGTKIQGLAIGPLKSLFNRFNLTCLSGSSSPIFLRWLVPCKKTCPGSSSRTEILLANNISLNPCQVLLLEPPCKTWEGFVSHFISYTLCWKPLNRHTLHS